MRQIDGEHKQPDIFTPLNLFYDTPFILHTTLNLCDASSALGEDLISYRFLFHRHNNAMITLLIIFNLIRSPGSLPESCH